MSQWKITVEMRPASKKNKLANSTIRPVWISVHESHPWYIPSQISSCQTDRWRAQSSRSQCIPALSSYLTYLPSENKTIFSHETEVISRFGAGLTVAQLPSPVVGTSGCWSSLAMHTGKPRGMLSWARSGWENAHAYTRTQTETEDLCICEEKGLFVSRVCNHALFRLTRIFFPL